MSKVTLSEHQNTVYENVVEELKEPNAVVVMKGYAGTGKTTMLKPIAEAVASSVGCYPLLAALTGKAAKRIGEATGLSTSTIHKLIYDPIIENGKLIGWERKTEIPPLPVLIDEASMVSSKVYDDLVSLVTKSGASILFTGDGFQLPPVEDDFDLMSQAKHELLEIHRQAEGSPIIKASMLLRKKVSASDLLGSIPKRAVSEQFNWDADETIICLSNKDRVNFNMRIRKRRFDVVDDKPREGDRIVILKNNHKEGLLNGEVLHINSIISMNSTTARVTFMELGSQEYTISLHCFHNEKPDFKEVASRHSDVLYADFGYALTCHKSQGSQFDKVYILDPTWFKRKSPEQYYRWMYTAVTRAVKEAIIVH